MNVLAGLSADPPDQLVSGIPRCSGSLAHLMEWTPLDGFDEPEPSVAKTPESLRQALTSDRRRYNRTLRAAAVTPGLGHA